MIEIKGIGKYEVLPMLLQAVLDEDIDYLEQEVGKGADVSAEVTVSKYTALTPLTFAFIMEKREMIYWLVGKGVNLNNKQHPAFLDAVRYSDEEVIRFIAGQECVDIHCIEGNAYSQAQAGNRLENFAVIHSLGYTVKEYGGDIFRTLVFYIAIGKATLSDLDFFIANDVDINYNQEDMVVSKMTPLCIAACHGTLELCRWLIEHGADVTKTDQDGLRPYTFAIIKGDQAKAEYLKSLEPAHFHDKQKKLDELKSYSLPQELFTFLQGDNLTLECKTPCGIEWIRFFSLWDTVPMVYDGQDLLRLSATNDDYDHVVFLWSPKDEKIVSYDQEHEELIVVAKAEDFLIDAGKCINEVVLI